jgi:hypothetical protein
MRFIVLLSGMLLLFQFTSAQNVGIGTNNPLDKLHVAGGILSDGLRIDGGRYSDILAQVNFNRDITDQQQLVADQKSLVLEKFATAWQSFTAGMSGELVSISFMLNTTISQVRFTLYTGEGTGGTPLYSAILSQAIDLISTGFSTAKIYGVRLTAGQKYTFAIGNNTGEREVFIRGTENDSYPAGKSSFGAADFTFRTIVNGTVPGLVVKNEGMVGIGTSNPASLLDVAGNLNVSGNITLGGTFNYNGSFVNESPISLPMSNGWVNYGSGFQGATYYKDRNGIVHLEGLIKNGTSNVIAVLPAGYRPGAAQIFIGVNGYAGFARIDVNPNGTVSAVAPYTNGYLSLSGITFRATQ